MKGHSHHLWIDLAFLAPQWARTSEKISEEVQNRFIALNKEFDLMGIASHDWKVLHAYSRALGAWASVTPTLAKWMPLSLVDDLRALSPDLIGDRVGYAQTVINQYLLESDARLGMQMVNGGLGFTVSPSAPLHRVTTAPWYAFTINPYTISRCDWCGLSYTPRRTTSQFCSPACRQASHKASKGLKEVANG